MRIQSIPAVYAFFQGRPVDGFVGAQPESEVKHFVQKLAQAAAPPGRPVADRRGAGAGRGGAGRRRPRHRQRDLRPGAGARARQREGGRRPRALLHRRGRAGPAPSRSSTPCRRRPSQAIRRSPRARTAARAGRGRAEGGRASRRSCAPGSTPTRRISRRASTLAQALFAGGERESGVDQLLEIIRATAPGTKRRRASSW